MDLCPQCGTLTNYGLPFVDDDGDRVCSLACVVAGRMTKRSLAERAANLRLPSGRKEYPVREHSDVGNEE